MAIIVLFSFYYLKVYMIYVGEKGKKSPFKELDKKWSFNNDSDYNLIF